jgi:hypothetical protein
VTARAVRRIAVGLVLAAAATAAPAFTLRELQGLLRSAPIQVVPFHELRESPWLAAPIESSGTLHSSQDVLEKRVVAPRRETWRLLPEQMEWVGEDGVTSKRILYTEAPAVATLAKALRRIVSADLMSLTRDFRVELSGDEQRWAVQLQPRESATARYLQELELQGRGPRLQVIIVVERQGERTTTTLQP